ncbi:MAG: Rpn family recombination-promoting nuclease/putative transposase, partial [Ruminococcus sp.]|nr:Rpn family recombination-promoting nuclease/putative transposase [Ruminococcus sp.]
MMKMYPKEYYEAIEEFRLMDDTFMSAVFDNDIPSVNLLLNIILNRSDMETISVATQVSYSNLLDRSIRIDIEAKDSSDKIYNIEVQNRSDEANVRRARYHSSMIDTKLLHRRQKFSSLVDSYVIFITEHDIIGANLPIYHIDRIVRETAADFGDGSHIIYVNADIDSDDTPLARLMHDFKCKKAAEMYYPQLACRVSMIKNTEGGRDTMCEIMERLNEKAI